MFKHNEIKSLRSVRIIQWLRHGRYKIADGSDRNIVEVSVPLIDQFSIKSFTHAVLADILNSHIWWDRKAFKANYPSVP